MLYLLKLTEKLHTVHPKLHSDVCYFSIKFEKGKKFNFMNV